MKWKIETFRESAHFRRKESPEILGLASTRICRADSDSLSLSLSLPPSFFVNLSLSLSTALKAVKLLLLYLTKLYCVKGNRWESYEQQRLPLKRASVGIEERGNKKAK